MRYLWGLLAIGGMVFKIFFLILWRISQALNIVFLQVQLAQNCYFARYECKKIAMFFNSLIEKDKFSILMPILMHVFEEIRAILVHQFKQVFYTR